MLLFSVLLLASIDVDNIIVSSQFLLNSCSIPAQFLLEVIFSPSSSILKWCSINANSSSQFLFVAPPGDHPSSSFRAAGRPSISFFLAPPGANPFLYSSRRWAPIYTIFILRASGRQSILSSLLAPRGDNPYPHSLGPPGASPNRICFSSPTGDHQESSRRRAIIKNHCANGQASRIIPPTGDYQQSSCRRMIINNHRADGRLSPIIASTGAPPI